MNSKTRIINISKLRLVTKLATKFCFFKVSFIVFFCSASKLALTFLSIFSKSNGLVVLIVLLVLLILLLLISAFSGFIVVVVVVVVSVLLKGLFIPDCDILLLNLHLLYLLLLHLKLVQILLHQ